MNERIKPLLLLYAPPEREFHGGRGVARRYLVSRLNFLNFKGEPVLVSMKGADGAPLLRATPLPCAGERLELRWVPRQDLGLLKTHRVDALLVPDGAALLLVHPDPIEVGEEGIAVRLPEQCRSFRGRGALRARGEVAARLSQGGAQFRGTLADFNGDALRLEVEPGAFPLNPGLPVRLELTGAEFLFAADCTVVRREEPSTLVLRPLAERLAKFPAQRHRDPRVSLSPTPRMVARHPLSGRTLYLPVDEISGTGFVVREGSGNTLLLPGLVLPEATISLGSSPGITCRAQVVARAKKAAGGGIRCALAILDMAPREQERLLSLLPQQDGNAAAGELDTELLWEFLFETGFVYPEKYLLLEGEKEKVKKTYRRLYSGHPGIARFFTVQDRGAIQGHLAMLRFFSAAWMIQHHAARKSLTLRAGLAVLKQAARYVNALRRLPSAHLRFVYCYFRPENKLPNRVFGGAARHLDDQGRCSLDRFAYGEYRRSTPRSLPLAPGWELSRARERDLERLREFYRGHSGGLVLRAFDLEGGTGGAELARAYRSSGFKREKRIYALRRGGETVLVALALRSDPGLNLSELTDCVTLFVLDPRLEPRIAEQTLARLSERYRGHRMPVLCYPHRYAETGGVPHGKEYLLWILDLAWADDYLDFFADLMPGGRTRPQPEEPEPAWEPTS